MAHIIYYLDVKTVLNLSNTCRRLRSVADSKFTWNCLIARDFDSLSNAIGPNLEQRIRKPKDSYRLLSIISSRESGEKENNSDHTRSTSAFDRGFTSRERQLIRFSVNHTAAK